MNQNQEIMMECLKLSVDAWTKGAKNIGKSSLDNAIITTADNFYNKVAKLKSDAKPAAKKDQPNTEDKV